MDSHTNEVTVEVYVRPEQLLEPIDTKIDTLHQLEAADHIDNLLLHAWPRAIMLTEQTPYSDAINAFEQMEAWADEHGVSIRPPFSVRTTTSTFTDETQTKLRTPMMCLAVYVGEQLVNIFPHSRADDQYSVTDAIAALRTDELELFPFAPNSTTPPPTHCQGCQTLLTRIQGIGVCEECNQVEVGTAPRREQSQQSRFMLQP